MPDFGGQAPCGFDKALNDVGPNGDDRAWQRGHAAGGWTEPAGRYVGTHARCLYQDLVSNGSV